MKKTPIQFRVIFEKQHWHLLSLLVLLGCIYFIFRTNGFLTGKLFGLSTLTWTIIALANTIFHQVFVLIVWRLELYYQWISKHFGKTGFVFYGIFFFIFFIARLVLVIFLSLSNHETFSINFIVKYVIAGIITVPVIYTFYSVLRFFSIERALGIDHFDHSYRNKQLERRGIYKITDNAMYIFGLLVLLIPGIIFSSKAALAVGVFNYIYIWVHYFFTELPDMQYIYGSNKNE